MPKQKSTGQEPEESSSSGEQETVTKTSMSEYEKQRLQRIRDNNKRMEELGLRKMASSLMGSGSDSAKKKEKLKGKAKADDDEEYQPVEAEDDLSSEDEVDDDENDEDFVAAVWKAKHKSSTPKKKAPNLKKKGSIKKLLSATDNMDEDEALKLAIALSMQESGVTDMGSSGDLRNTIEKKGSAQLVEDKGVRKRKKPMAKRVQMTEDELVMHFFQFDEAGKGGINLRDLRKMVGTHDFTWSDSEMADMIKYFDNDGDGKLSLDDFRKIASRCNMISET